MARGNSKAQTTNRKWEKGAAAGSRSVLLLVDPARGTGRIVSCRVRPWHRLLARWLAPSLDRHLAGGDVPESGLLLALRAQRLVSPTGRRRAAEDWQHLLDRALCAGARVQPALVRPCSDRIREAEPEMQRLISLFVAPFPMAARGAAMAGGILRDGAGPVYNPRSTTNLGALVRAAIDQLGPSAGLVAAP
jgi:hypothetical protein